MRIKFAKPKYGLPEIAAANAVMRGQGSNAGQVWNLTNAGQVQAFEDRFCEYIGGGMAVATSSCTSALHAALLALDVGKGDEVIVPALTFAACGHVVEAVGAVPVFADCHPDAGQLDPWAVNERITERTKAVMVMHFAGRAGYMGSIVDTARRRKIRIVEDCATALGAMHSGKHVGLQGDIGCFSFHPVKHITTGEGGMLVTTNPEIWDRARAIREFGKVNTPYADPIDKHPMPYEIRSFGLNFRMTEIQGAIGCAQLAGANEKLAIRRSNYYKLEAALRTHGIKTLDLGGDESAAYCLVAHMPDGLKVPQVRQCLAKRGIETSVYYPGPLPLMPYYRDKYGYKPGDFPHAERIAQHTIAFSVGPHLGSAEMAYTVESLKEILK